NSQPCQATQHLNPHRGHPFPIGETVPQSSYVSHLFSVKAKIGICTPFSPLQWGICVVLFMMRVLRGNIGIIAICPLCIISACPDHASRKARAINNGWPERVLSLGKWKGLGGMAIREILQIN